MSRRPRPPSPFLKLSDVAKRLDISVKTLARKFLETGQIPWYDFHGTMRVRASDLVEYAERNRLVLGAARGDER